MPWEVIKTDAFGEMSVWVYDEPIPEEYLKPPEPDSMEKILADILDLYQNACGCCSSDEYVKSESEEIVERIKTFLKV